MEIKKKNYALYVGLPAPHPGKRSALDRISRMRRAGTNRVNRREVQSEDKNACRIPSNAHPDTGAARCSAFLTKRAPGVIMSGVIMCHKRECPLNQ